MKPGYTIWMTIKNSGQGPLLRAGTLEQAPNRAILEQAGNYCAFPGCEHRSYLEIAHIRAVSAGGPRHDPARPTGPGTANLILLCASHHRLVDAEPHRYSADFLQKLRADALASADKKCRGQTRSGGQQQALGLQASSLAEALQVWDHRAGNEPESFWHKLFVDVPELLALAVPGDTVQYGSKCYVGGKVVRNVDGNVVDFLYQSSTTLSVTLVEIKRPDAELIGSEYHHMHAPSAELIGSVMQVLGYRDTLQKDYYSLTRDPDARAMRVFNPKALVVIGDLEAEVLDESQRRSFELFRNGISNVIVLTFDQLFGKVRQTVDLIEQAVSMRQA